MRRVSWRRVRQRPLRITLTVIGIGAGVALVVAVAVINTTLRSSIVTTVSAVERGDPLEISAPTDAGLGASTIRAVRREPAVKQLVPALRVTADLIGRSSGRERTLIVGTTFGITELLPPQRPGARLALLPLDLKRSARIIYPSATLAARLHLKRGTRLQMQTPAGVVTVRVAIALPDAAFGPIGAGAVALMPFAETRSLFGKGPDQLFVVGRRGTSARGLARRLRAAAPGTVVGRPGATTRSAKATFESIAAITQQTTVASLIVGILVVLNTMQMAILERRRELAVLGMLGVAPRSICAALVVEAAVIGAVAGCLGAAVGAVMAAGLVGHVLDSYKALPFTADAALLVIPRDLIQGLLLGPIVAIAGVLPPAIRTLRAPPSSGLRPQGVYEWEPGRRTLVLRWLAPVGASLWAAAAVLAVVGGSNRATVNLAIVAALLGSGLLIREVVPRMAARMTGRGSRRAVSLDLVLKSPGRTSLMLAGLVLAAATMVGLATGLTSYQHAIRSTAETFYRAPLYVKAPGPGPLTSDQRLQGSLTAELAQLPGVEAAYPIRLALMTDGVRQTLIYAVPASESARRGDEVVGPVGGDAARFLANLTAGRLVVSGVMSTRRALASDSALTLPSQPAPRTFPLGGVFDDVVSTDSLYMEHGLYGRIWRDETVDRVAVIPTAGTSPARVKATLERYLVRHRLPGQALTGQGLVTFTVDSLAGLFSLARTIQGVALLLAGLIVATTMLTVTTERRREFALQRLIGMTDGQVRRAILAEAATLGVLGAIGAVVVGLPLGVLMSLVIEAQIGWRVPIALPVDAIALVMAVTVIISVAAAIYPAERVLRRPIADSLPRD